MTCTAAYDNTWTCTLPDAHEGEHETPTGDPGITWAWA
jgi:hypothetical protein